MMRLQTKPLQFQEVKGIQIRYQRMGVPFRICVYYVDGLFIETGPIRARQAVSRFVQQQRPEAVTLTHHHEDHSGNAGWLSEMLGVPVYMGEETARILKTPYRIPLYRRLVWGQMEAVPDPTPAEVIETGNCRFRRVFTPGHADDHVAWIEEERGWAFTGDLFLGTRLTWGLKGESVAELARSIRRVLSYPVHTVFCSHVGVVEEGRRALEEKLHFLEWLQEETCRLHHSGASTREIARRLLKRQPAVEWFSGGELSPVHLIRSIVNEKGA